MRGSSAYSVSKAAAFSLTRAIAVEIDRELYPDVLINDLVPLPVKSQMNPESRDDPTLVYPTARFLVELPAGGPSGQIFQNNRIVQTDYGIKARLRRKLAGVRGRITGTPTY